jgi:hypothetical protein
MPQREKTDRLTVFILTTLTLAFIVGVICSIYGGIQININSTDYNTPAKIFVVGIGMTAISGVLLLILVYFEIYIPYMLKSNNLSPIVVVKQLTHKQTHPDAKKKTYVNPIVKIGRNTH